MALCNSNCSEVTSNVQCHDDCYGTGEVECHDHCYGTLESNCHDHCFGAGDTYCHDHCYGAGDSTCHNQCYGPEDLSCHDQCYGAGDSNCHNACLAANTGTGSPTTSTGGGGNSGGGGGTTGGGGGGTTGGGGGGTTGGGGGTTGGGGGTTGGGGGSTGGGGGSSGRGTSGTGLSGGRGGSTTGSGGALNTALPGNTGSGVISQPGAGGLGLGTAINTGKSGSGRTGTPKITVPLAGGTTSLNHHGQTTAARRTPGVNQLAGTHGLQLVSSAGPATLIQRFIDVIPWWMWLAFGLLAAAATVAGVAAVRSGRRARARAGEVATVTADAITDPLTGILNRRGFTTVAERELERAQRYGHALALAFVDVRGLKGVNDTRGHQAGDRLLKQVAVLLKESSRSHDVVGRIGGDELAVLLTEQGADGMAAVMRRVKSQLPATREALGFDHDWDLTIGMAVFPRDGHSVEDLLATADRRLYMQRGIELR